MKELLQIGLIVALIVLSVCMAGPRKPPPVATTISPLVHIYSCPQDNRCRR